MRVPRGAADRFLALVEQRLVPPFETLGFERRRAVLERDAGDVRWLVEVQLSSWSNPEKICFTLAWGVAVPGLDHVLGQESPVAPADRCLVRALLGEGAHGVDARWFTVAPLPGWAAPVPGIARLVDTRTASAVLALAGTDLLPALRRLDSIPAVQEILVEGLVRGRGAAGAGELARIRRIAGLSALLGERDNAARWLDYLEARSSSSMAPDLVAERLAVLREQCLAS